MEHNSYLIQRLNEPFPNDHRLFKDNPFSFGGGLKNGGVSDEAMDMIRGIWSFDYMGAAEFEFGAAAEGLHKIAKKAGTDALASRRITVKLGDVEQPWQKDAPTVDLTEEASIYLLGPTADLDEIEERVRALAAGTQDWRMKEVTRLPQSLIPVNEWDTRVQGWLELDNGYFFFTDQEMWEKTCDLFGVNRAK